MKFDKRKSDKAAQDLLSFGFEKAGRGPEKIDCMGVIINYFKEFEIEIPDYSNIKDWGEYDEEYIKAIPKIVRRLEPNEALEIGDIIIFSKTYETTGNLNHAGVYLGENQFIHACQKLGVKIDTLIDKTWKGKVYGYFRLRNSK